MMLSPGCRNDDDAAKHDIFPSRRTVSAQWACTACPATRRAWRRWRRRWTAASRRPPPTRAGPTCTWPRRCSRPTCAACPTRCSPPTSTRPLLVSCYIIKMWWTSPSWLQNKFAGEYVHFKMPGVLAFFSKRFSYYYSHIHNQKSSYRPRSGCSWISPDELRGYVNHLTPRSNWCSTYTCFSAYILTLNRTTFA